jgi:hypothetical protein
VVGGAARRVTAVVGGTVFEVPDLTVAEGEPAWLRAALPKGGRVGATARPVPSIAVADTVLAGTWAMAMAPTITTAADALTPAKATLARWAG